MSFCILLDMCRNSFCLLLLVILGVASALRMECPKLPRQPRAASVTELRPQDIDVVMAIGDSVTAGFAMDNQAEEFRQGSFSIGAGTDGYLTLPSLIKHYNPNLVGFSVGTHKFEGSGSSHIPEQDQLNAAQSSARVEALIDQIKYLELLLPQFDKNMNDSWKHLSLFIGANNLCVTCFNGTADLPDFFEMQIELALDYLYKHIPKTFVSLITIPKFSDLAFIQSSWCKLVHTFYKECACLYTGKKEDEELVDLRTDEFNERLFNVAKRWKSRNLKEFAVVVQPYGIKTVIDSQEYVSTLDCFHPSKDGHSRMAIALWNSLLLPDSKKPRSVHYNDTKIICPDENSILYTF